MPTPRVNTLGGFSYNLGVIMSSNITGETILGVDKNVLVAFLELLKHKYRLADEANLFLEQNTKISGISVAITNQRDVIGHLITLLTEAGLSRDEQMAQVATSEEHLRRAILESYQITVDTTWERVEKLIETYKQIVLPLQDNPILKSGPDLNNINSRLLNINKHRHRGRIAKGQNLWDEKWEEGPKAFIDAFKKLRELEIILEQYIIRATQIREDKENRRNWIRGYILAIIFGLITMFGVIYAL